MAAPFSFFLHFLLLIVVLVHVVVVVVLECTKTIQCGFLWYFRCISLVFGQIKTYILNVTVRPFLRTNTRTRTRFASSSAVICRSKHSQIVNNRIHYFVGKNNLKSTFSHQRLRRQHFRSPEIHRRASLNCSKDHHGIGLLSLRLYCVLTQTPCKCFMLFVLALCVCVCVRSFVW